MSAVLLDVGGLGVAFGGVRALDGVDLRVAKGSVHGLVGPNGAGKTTLLNCVTRLIQPDAGTIRFDGVDLMACAAHEMAALGISRTFQNFGLIAQLNVLENVMLGWHARHPGTLLDELLRFGRRNRFEREAREQSQQALARAGLADFSQRAVGSLSYGMRKGVELARADVLQPRLLLLDEPTAGLSRAEMQSLAGTIARMRERSGVTVLVITHHIEFLLEVADEVTVLDLGQRIAAGSPTLLRDDPRVVAAYVGTEDVE